MTAEVLNFPATDDDVAIEPDAPMVELEPEPEPEPAIEPDKPSVATLPARFALTEVLPADFRLPALIKFIPNPALRTAADEAATYALSVKVDGTEGLASADLALTALRASLKAIDEHLEEPIGLAHELHKRLTTVRADWQATGKSALQTVGSRVFTEQRRLEAIAADERRKAQELADRQAREDAKRRADEAQQAKAPAPVVEELKRQAETITAPPVATPAAVAAPALRGSTTVTTWKVRLAGTSGSTEPTPSTENLSPAQREQVLTLLRAIVDGKAPIAAVEVNWSYLGKRAKADKSTLAVPGIEAYEEGGVRAKSTRSR